jgi:Rieske Fe-S protein
MVENQESVTVQETKINKPMLIIGGVVALAAVVLWIGLSNPTRAPSQVRIGHAEDFPIDSVTPLILNVHFTDRGPLIIQDEPLPHDIFPLRIFVVVDAREGWLALYNRDPHAGCQVRWVEADERFVDPCHGSFYTRTGEHIEGPSPRGLDRFPIGATDDGELFIDLNGYQLGNAAER